MNINIKLIYIKMSSRIHQIFKPSELIIYTDNSMEYTPIEELEKSLIRPWNELRVLLNEVYFLSLFWDLSIVSKPEVVVITDTTFVEHYDLLCDMFPWISFTIYSQINFELEEKGSSLYAESKVINKILDFTELEHWKLKRSNLYLIFNLSDDFKDNLDYQYKIHQELDPVKSIMRVKFPETDSSFRYLDGIAFRQGYIKKDSEEIFLCPYDSITLRDWPVNKMNSLIKAHNFITREVHMDNNESIQINPGKPYINTELGISRSYDGMYLMFIIKQYLSKFKPINSGHVLSIEEQFDILSFILHNILKSKENRLVPKKKVAQ